MWVFLIIGAASFETARALIRCKCGAPCTTLDGLSGICQADETTCANNIQAPECTIVCLFNASCPTCETNTYLDSQSGTCVSSKLTCRKDQIRAGASATSIGRCDDCVHYDFSANGLYPTTTMANTECKPRRECILQSPSEDINTELVYMFNIPANCSTVELMEILPNADEWTNNILIPFLIQADTVMEYLSLPVFYWSWPTNKTLEASLVDALKANTVIRTLAFRNNEFGDASATALAEVIKASVSLTHLDLWENQITDTGAFAIAIAIAIAEALNGSVSLTHLDLSKNYIGPDGQAALRQAVADKDSFVLSLASQHWSVVGCPAGMRFRNDTCNEIYWAACCGDCPENTYQNETDHLETECKSQPTCAAGFFIEISKTKLATCTACLPDTYVDEDNHRHTECKPQPQCERPVVTIKVVPGAGFATTCVTEGCFVPVRATVDIGGEVIFSNTDSIPHTFRSGTVDTFVPTPDLVFDTGVLSPGDISVWVPTGIGEFPYYCFLHTYMVGTIIVQEPNEERILVGATLATKGQCLPKQVKCSAGEAYTPNEMRGECKPCPANTYQIEDNHTLTECEPQPECDQSILIGGTPSSEGQCAPVPTPSPVPTHTEVITTKIIAAAIVGVAAGTCSLIATAL
jgi:hypothetical protein